MRAIAPTRSCTNRWLLAALVLCAGIAQAAGPDRLSDALSAQQRVEPISTVFNATPLDDAPPTLAEVRFGWVNYRLNTARYVGKSARIYYVVPSVIANLDAAQALRVEWRARNGFNAGRAHAGERTLVWSGVVRSASIEEAFDLVMTLELARLRGRIGFESFFEIEVQ